MDKYFVTHSQAVALKELGFDMPCFRYVYIGDTGNNIDRYEEVEPSRAKNYNKYFLCVSQPLKSQVFEWFRDKHNLYHEIRTFAWDYDKKELGFSIRTYLNPIDIETERLIHSEVYETYKEAESACIDKLIEILQHGR